MLRFFVSVKYSQTNLKNVKLFFQKLLSIRLILYICAHKCNKFSWDNFKKIQIIKYERMKNINYVINGILAAAVIILFILQFSGNKNSTPFSGTVTTASREPIIELPVAYVNVDSLLDNYIFSVDLNEALVRKRENIQAGLVQQQRNWQSEVENFNYRLQNNAFTSQARLEQEQSRLQRRQAELEALAEKQSIELGEEYQRVNMQLRDTIMTHLKEYNQAKGYHIIYSNTSSSLVSPILWAEDVYNITTEFTDYLNKKWTSQGGN